MSLLAPLLHGAAVAGHPMGRVLRWVDRHDGSAALSVLAGRSDGGGPGADVLAGILTTDEREQSGIWSTASGVLGAYRWRPPWPRRAPPFLDAHSFCSGPNTLYVCAAGGRQRLVAPLVVGLLSELRDAAYRRAGAGPPTWPPSTRSPTLPRSPTWRPWSVRAPARDCDPACLQDLSQARARWGEEARRFSPSSAPRSSWAVWPTW